LCKNIEIPEGFILNQKEVQELQDYLDSNFVLDYKVLPSGKRDISGFYLTGSCITRTLIKNVMQHTGHELRNIKTTDNGKVSVFFEKGI